MKPLIALCMIVRNDARSLERALESAKVHVDEIDIGIDDRTTDPDTRKVAEKFTSSVWTFGHADVGLSAEQWQAGLIHFANARNLGWARVRSPWIMHFDSDEYLECRVDLRALAGRYMFTPYNSFSVWRATANFEFRDPTRFARAHLRWRSPTHNQLPGARPDFPIEAKVIQDTSLRSTEDNQRRNEQRNAGMELLRPLAEEGDQNAIYHLAKHDTFLGNLGQGAKWAEKYLASQLAHGEFSDSRATLCVAVGQRYGEEGEILAAEMWAVRALFDGPHPDAFALLTELAKLRGDSTAAETWAKAVEFAPERDRMRSK